MGIHSTQISALERGRENPGYARLIEVAEALDTSVAELTGLADHLFAEDSSSAGSRTGRKPSGRAQ